MELPIGIASLIVAAVALYIAYLQLQRTPRLPKKPDAKPVLRPPSTLEPRVFISYARKDGEEFALKLLQEIEAENIPCWLDRAEMKGGQDWWNQIKDALNVVEYLVLVMTPGAIKSEWTRKEWIYARQQGVCVFPVIAAQGLDFKSLPRWMRDVHFYDLDHQRQKFINDLNIRCEKVRVPFMVEDLPKNFVHRPVEFEKMIASLLDENKEEPMAITTALKGAGGFGKTTLALAVCHDERIARAFDDGILWVTLGESPGDIVNKIADLIIRLAGENPGYTTVEAASDHLAGLLEDRDILLVIDDVWDAAHLRPFLRGGARCTRLITTRNSATLPSEVLRIDVDEMQPQEAMALLGMGLPIYDMKDLQTLTTRLGEWPILLNLVNARLNERIKIGGQDLSDAVAYINRALDKHGITAFDIQDSVERNKAVDATLGLSLELLPENEKARFIELAVFPEDVKIPLNTLTKYWHQTAKLDDVSTEQLCERLFRLSLLQRYDFAIGTISIHDVVRGYLISKATDKITGFHNALLDAYNLRLWSEMPEGELYMWEHLTEHLICAGQIEELLETVKDFEYLEKKTWVRKAYAVEKDLRLTVDVSKAETIQLLYRIFRASSHLFNQCSSQKDLKATLCSRFLHIQGTRQLAIKYAETIERPCILPNSQPPDLPHPAQIRALSGHTESLNSVLISQDNSTICSGATDYTLRIWDAQSGELRHLIEVYEDVRSGSEYEPSDYPGGARPIAMNENGSIVVTKAGDGSLRIWDTQKGTLLRTTLGDVAVINPSSKDIVLESRDFFINVWDSQEGKHQCKLEGHWNSVSAIVMSLDGATIVSASFDRTVRVWNAQNGKVLHVLSGHLFPVKLLALSRDGKTVFSGSRANDLRVWDIESGKLKHHLKNRHDYYYNIDALDISTDGKTLFAVSSEGLETWDEQTGELKLISEVRSDDLTILIKSPHEMLYVAFVSYLNNHVITIWNLKNNKLHHELECQGGPVRILQISQDQRTLLSFTQEKFLQLWDVQSGKLLQTIQHLTPIEIHELTIEISVDASIIILGSKDNTLHVWDMQNRVLRYVLTGQQNPAISPDGNIVVSSSENGILHIWDAATGKLRHTLDGHEGQILKILISPDSNAVISGSSDKSLRLWSLRDGKLQDIIDDRWDYESVLMYGVGGRIISISNKHAIQVCNAQNGQCHQEFEIPAEWTEILAISPNSHNFVLGYYSSEGYNLQLGDAQTGEMVQILNALHNKVKAISFSLDGKFIVLSSQDGRLQIWDSQGSEIIGLDGLTSGAEISPDGRTIVLGSHEVIQVWDMDGRKLRHTLRGHTQDVKMLVMSSDGNTVISSSEDGIICKWDVKTGRLLHTLAGYAGDVQTLTLSFDGSILISGADDNIIRMWDTVNDVFWDETDDRKDKIYAIMVSTDGSTIFSYSDFGRLGIWNIEGGRLREVEELQISGGTFQTVSADGSVVVFSYGEDKLKIWNRKTGELQDILIERNEQQIANDIYAVAISPDGNYIAVGFYYGSLRIWDVKMGKLMHHIFGQFDGSVMEVTFSPDGGSIVTGVDDNRILLWETISGNLRHTLEYPRHPWYRYSICCDDKLIVSDSTDHDLWIWDAQSGSRQHILKGHTDRVNGIAISPESRTIVSASDDNTLRIWDVESGELRHILRGHTRPVQTLSISPNGKTIASGSLDNTLRIWDVETGKYIGGVCVDGAVEYCAWHKSGKHIIFRGKGGSYIFDYLE